MRVIRGTCDGTGAAINVCLGVVPFYVKVWNAEDAGALLPVAEWLRDMDIITALDEGIVHTGLDDTDFDRTVMAANGISAYDGGDEIQFDKDNDNRWEVVTAFPAGASVEEVYVDGSYRRTATTDSAYRCYGDAVCPNPVHGIKVKTSPGFVIGTNANLNADGEQLLWMAFIED